MIRAMWNWLFGPQDGKIECQACSGTGFTTYHDKATGQQIMCAHCTGSGRRTP